MICPVSEEREIATAQWNKICVMLTVNYFRGVEVSTMFEIYTLPDQPVWICLCFRSDCRLCLRPKPLQQLQHILWPGYRKLQGTDWVWSLKKYTKGKVKSMVRSVQDGFGRLKIVCWSFFHVQSQHSKPLQRQRTAWLFMAGLAGC